MRYNLLHCDLSLLPCQTYFNNCPSLQVAIKLHFEATEIAAECVHDLPISGCAAVLTLHSADGTCRTHAITVLDGLLFDSDQPEPLVITDENLSRCMGVEYGGIVRGYLLEPQAARGAAPSRMAQRRAAKRAARKAGGK